MDLLRLRAGRLAVDLAPHAGGSIARFAIEGADGPVDLLRPADLAALTGSRGNASSLVRRCTSRPSGIHVKTPFR